MKGTGRDLEDGLRTGRRSGSGWAELLRTHGDKDVERPQIRDTNQELQPWRQEAATRQEGGRTESEGGDTDWLGHFCPQGSAFLGG